MNKFYIDNQNNFLVYKTTPSDIRLAEKIYQENFQKTNLLNSKTVYDRKESRIAGILGEIVFGYFLGDNGRYVGRGNVTYDFELEDKKIDVKCKLRNVVPKQFFEASFFVYQGDKHFCDVTHYAFLSTVPSFEYTWFCGLATKNEWLYNKKGRLWKAGDVDSSNGMKFHKDTWSIKYKDLKQFEPDLENCFI